MAAQTDYPFLVPLTVVLTANAQADMTFNVPAGQRLHIKSWLWVSTGIFNLLDVRIQTNLRYTSANQTTPILSSMLQSPATANLSLRDLIGEIIIDPNNTFALTVKDTSGAGNTLNVTLNCHLESPAQ